MRLLSLQFLPQDKVVMFARLSPTDLLKETEKSIGDAELHRIHAQLIEKKNEETDTSHVSVPAIVAVLPSALGCTTDALGRVKHKSCCADSSAFGHLCMPIPVSITLLHAVGSSAGC